MLLHSRFSYNFSKSLYKNYSILFYQSQSLINSRYISICPHYFHKQYFGPTTSSCAKIDRSIHISICDYNIHDDQIKKGQPVVEPDENDKKLPLWERFKIIMKKYWYVLIPVHALTTMIWLGSFWYAAKCGMDIVPLLRKLGVPNSFVEPLEKSGASYFATAYALYKLITPIRYAVTVGGATFAIKYLKRYGYIKPIPSSQEIKKMVRTLREHRIKRFKKKKSSS